MWGVVNRTLSDGLELELGVGVGLTNATDHVTFKFDFAKDLNKPKKKIAK